MDALVGFRKDIKVGGLEVVTAGYPAPATSLRGMQYAKGTVVVSQWPGQPKKSTVVIMIVRVAFSLTVL